MTSDVGVPPSVVTVLVAGVSARAPAESAARAGFAVTAIDAFADVDQYPSVRAHSLADRFSPDAAARYAQTIACHAVTYGSNFENHPRAIARLAQGRVLWGNPPGVVRRVRDPVALAEALRRHGLAAPQAILQPASGKGPPQNEERRAARSRLRSQGIAARHATDRTVTHWLLKPLASGGGHRIRMWQDGDEVPRRHYLQELIEGTPASMVFVACGGTVAPIGFSRQLIGDEAFGVSGYRYCGNIMTAAGEDDEVLDSAQQVAAAVGAEFGLVGVNGVDFVVRNGTAYAIEVNPRWCASMELVERAYGLSVFGAHVAACHDGRLPVFDLAEARRGATTVGKAVVFARHDVTVPDPHAWLADPDVRDVPAAGSTIAAGRPICSIYAAGGDARECHGRLVERAGRIYRQLPALSICSGGRGR